MKLLNKFGFGIFWMLAIADAYFIFQNIEQYRLFTKPLLVPILLLTIFATISRRKNGQFKSLLALSFLSATVGDILLLYATPSSPKFVIGLICFLVTHLLLTIYFLKIYNLNLQSAIAPLVTLVVVGGFATWLIFFLKPYLNNQLIPVVIYSFVLSIMLSAAVNLVGSKTINQTALETFYSRSGAVCTVGFHAGY